jgi:small subunit ribosomal protein S16
MLKIRLKRCGRKKSPSYRIILTPSQSKRDGKALVEFGYYNPLTKDLKFDGEKILSYIQKGAQPSETVKNFLIKANIL